jgi:hypothetical protein
LKVVLAAVIVAVCSIAVFGQPSTGGGSTPNGPMEVFSQIEAMYPAPQDPAMYPLGNDLVLRARGSADLHIATMPVVITSSSAAGPGPATITVSSTAQLCPGTGGCAIVIDPNTRQEEVILPSNWNVDGPTQITATFAFPHTAGFTIEQVGAVSLDTQRVSLNGGDSPDRPLSFVDRNNNPVITVTNDTGGTWPNSAIRFLGLITGNNGNSRDLVIRYNTPQSSVRFLNSQNTKQLMTMDNLGVTNFYGNDVYVHGTLHVASVTLDNPAATPGQPQSLVQSPDAMTIFTGVAILDDGGNATVTLPASFVASSYNFSYQLTPIGQFAPLYISRELQNNTFSIAGGERRMRVSWAVTGVQINKGSLVGATH